MQALVVNSFTQGRDEVGRTYKESKKIISDEFIHCKTPRRLSMMLSTMKRKWHPIVL